MEIRATQESDRTYIARLNFLTDTFGDERGELSSDFTDDFSFYVENWEPNQGGFIAWEDLVPAGGVWLNWGTEDNHGYGFVEPAIPEFAIAVESRFAGQGIATALIDAAISLARTLKAPGISLAVHPDNPRAQGLYERLGFEHVGVYAEHYIMVKRFL
ncbi:GNAT family N-acetyltransferase [Corynebacterium sp. KPL2850]|uniref:GNAT family N-acetyltransferase n=1 Tax=Corynebacterium sp. KPL2850 TaxID=3158318 RepID=UPI0032ECE2E8